jgi:carbamoyl-phosphate synthase small subunit
LQKAVLALEDGSIFEGISFGAPAERTGEVVFNTAITGYQEIFTDPSYTGQIVVLTYPQIGNYGANRSDSESAKPYIEGLVVREISPVVSNWRADGRAEDFLAAKGIPIIAEVEGAPIAIHGRPEPGVESFHESFLRVVGRDCARDLFG